MLTLALQAGGESRRMGQDKALLPFLGQPLIQRVATQVAPAADEILVTTNRPADYAFLGYPCFPDLRPGRGALGGLFTALKAATQPLVGLVACDMPFANAQLLAFQAQLLLAEEADVVIPHLPGGYEPFHAVYRRATCLPQVEQALDAGELKLIAWFPRVTVRTLTLEACRPFDPAGLAFLNLNTPAELARAEALARANR